MEVVTIVMKVLRILIGKWNCQTPDMGDYLHLFLLLPFLYLPFIFWPLGVDICKFLFHVFIILL